MDLPTDAQPGDFHTNWEKCLWSDNFPVDQHIEDIVLVQDNPILNYDPFSMSIDEIVEVLPPQTCCIDWGHNSIMEHPRPETHTGKGAKRRRVGRPLKTEPGEVTPLPSGHVSRHTVKEARYRRMRDLNNIASQKCRLKK